MATTTSSWINHPIRLRIPPAPETFALNETVSSARKVRGFQGPTTAGTYVRRVDPHCVLERSVTLGFVA